MKINKTYIEIENKKLETYLTLYFQGDKEYISMSNNTIYIWCKEESQYEYWLELKTNDNVLFRKYLENKESLLNVIKSSELTVFKRYYEKYDNFVDKMNVKYSDIDNRGYVLPDKEATLGYDFYSIYESDTFNSLEAKKVNKYNVSRLVSEQKKQKCNMPIVPIYSTYSSAYPYQTKTHYDKFSNYERVA